MSSQLYLLHRDRSILSPRPDGHKGRGSLLLSARPPLWRPLLRSLGQWSLSRPIRRRRHYFVDNAPRGLVAKKAFSGNLSVCPRQQSCLLARSPRLSSARSPTLLPLSSSVHFFGRFRCHPPSSGPEAVSPSVGRPTGPSRSPLCPVPDTYGCELASGRSWRKEEGSG